MIKFKSPVKPDEKTIEIMKSILKRDNNSRELKSLIVEDDDQDN
jgi:hypothetical protein